MATAPERAHDYHQDPGDKPSLSSSIARLLVQKTPAHAKAAHPKLTDHPEQQESYAMSIGTAVHQMLLRDDRVVLIPFDSFRSKDAQDGRDAALRIGRVPVTIPMWDKAREVAQACNGAIVASTIRPTPFTQGQAEHVLRWQDNGADCRALIDWVRDDHLYIDDLKTTSDGSPSKFRRHVFNMGYDLRAMFYVRGVEAVYGVTPRFRWIVVETNPPYPVSVFEMSERAQASARAKVDLAISIWKDCLERDEWPAYGDTIHEVEIPGWVEDMTADIWAEVDLDEVPF